MAKVPLAGTEYIPGVTEEKALSEIKRLLENGPQVLATGGGAFMTDETRAAIRDAAISDNIPSMSDSQMQAFVDGRLPYNLGHAAFEFIESRWGKEGLRQFLFALRKAVIGGGESAYEEAFRLKPEEFDEQFERYLKERFKPFRDKERPGDYGRNLAPRADRTPDSVVVSSEPSPSGVAAIFSKNPANRVEW